MAAPAPDADGPRRVLYPEVEPYRTLRLPVGDGHELHLEECGNPSGTPALFLHGGPGGGCMPRHRRFWDPDAYRIVLFDQRGCGRSTPHATLEANTTWHLVADIESIRQHLGIDCWQVLGGSWGSALALAYAQAHAEAVTALVLRGIFLLRRAELRWFYQHGASELFPDAWERYLAVIPEREHHDLLAAYRARLDHHDPVVRAEAASAWSHWETATSTLRAPSEDPADDPDWAQAFARIENHYFVHGGWLTPETQLLDDIDRIRHLPATIVQGRYDVVCPVRSAWDLHRAWPEADLVIVPDAGHSTFEPGIVDALIGATDRLRDIGAP